MHCACQHPKRAAMGLDTSTASLNPARWLDLVVLDGDPFADFHCGRLRSRRSSMDGKLVIDHCGCKNSLEYHPNRILQIVYSFDLDIPDGANGCKWEPFQANAALHRWIYWLRSKAIIVPSLIMVPIHFVCANLIFVKRVVL